MEPTIETLSKPRPRSFHYASGLRWTGDLKGTLAALDKPRLEVAAPPEFRGHAGVWSPEDLLVAAVNACTMTTFLTLAKRRRLEILSYESEATGTLETEGGEFRFTRIVVHPRIEIRSEADRGLARAVFQEAEDRCLIANSLLSLVEGSPDVIVRA
jgi:organic hydroperoxide reductase OsmC/OhrA